MTPVIAGSINRTPTGPHRRCDMFTFSLGMGIFFQATNWEACFAYSLPMIQAGGCLSAKQLGERYWALLMRLSARLHLH